MNIKRTAASESRKWASNAKWVSLTGGLAPADVCDPFLQEPGTVDIVVNGCPDPNGRETAQYDYTVTLTAEEIVALLLKLKPESLASAIIRVLSRQPESEREHRDAAAKIPAIVQQFAQALYDDRRANE